MAQPSKGEDRNYVVSSQSLTEETTNTKKQRLITSTGTLTSPPSLDDEVPLPTLTFDLIAEILCRLPVKLLLQLQCLGKSYKSLISDPKFAKKHLRFSIKRHRLIVNSTNNLHEFVLYDSPISSVLSTFTFTQTQLSYPVSVKKRIDGPSAVCSCDGILCITNFNLSAFLWNPSIRKFKILPPLITSPKRCNFSLYSFGYDHFIDNYKIVVISACINKNEVSVHTLGTNYWRKIDDFPFSSCIGESGIFVSGTVNWFALDSLNSKCVIVSLDLEKESYQNIWSPDLEKDRWTLGVLKDCLCLYASNDMFLDVWVMKEYGNKESWVKLYHVPYMEDRGLYSYTDALYISEDDQMLMDFYELGSKELKLVVYDSKNGTLDTPKIQNINRSMDPEVYIESLISPCY